MREVVAAGATVSDMAYTSQLPKFADVHQDHTITLSEDVHVVFQIVAIPGPDFDRILDAHRDDEGKAARKDYAVDLLTAGIGRFYSSVQSSPVDFGEEDATEVWETWPDWARLELVLVVENYSTRGPRTDPKGGLNRNGNDDS